MNVVILKLKNNYYFVGSTPASTKPHILNYFHTYTNDWLDLHPIVDIMEIIPIQHRGLTEQEKALEVYCEIGKYMNIMMARYDILHVRGDVNSSIHLSKSEIREIQSFLKGAATICYKCHSTTHTSVNCHYVPSERSETPIHTGYRILTPFEVYNAEEEEEEEEEEEKTKCDKVFKEQFEKPEVETCEKSVFSSSHFCEPSDTTMDMFSSHSMLKSSYL